MRTDLHSAMLVFTFQWSMESSCVRQFYNQQYSFTYGENSFFVKFMIYWVLSQMAFVENFGYFLFLHDKPANVVRLAFQFYIFFLGSLIQVLYFFYGH